MRAIPTITLVLLLGGLCLGEESEADQLALSLTRQRMPLRYAWLSLLKDLALLPLWVFAIFSRTVVWRGRKLRFGKNTQLIPLDSDPVEVREPIAVKR